MRVFPNIEIVTPSDVTSMKVIIKDIIKKPRFLFLRLDRDVMSDIYNKNKKFNLKKVLQIRINGKKMAQILWVFA